jgi:nickel-type superoxide dismutase maturation protease
MFGFSTVSVSGSSMSPAYNQGDWLLVRSVSGQRHTLKVGEVYLIQDPNREGIKLIKRLTQARTEQGVTRYWLEGENKESTDSRSWGWLTRDQFLGKVVLKYRKGN